MKWWRWFPDGTAEKGRHQGAAAGTSAGNLPGQRRGCLGIEICINK